MSDKIEIICGDCGEIKIMPSVCPYTEFRYGYGWTCVCDICRGEMDVVNEYTVEELVAGEKSLDM